LAAALLRYGFINSPGRRPLQGDCPRIIASKLRSYPSDASSSSSRSKAALKPSRHVVGPPQQISSNRVVAMSV
jgi:hypothetical protein